MTRLMSATRRWFAFACAVLGLSLLIVFALSGGLRHEAGWNALYLACGAAGVACSWPAWRYRWLPLAGSVFLALPVLTSLPASVASSAGLAYCIVVLGQVVSAATSLGPPNANAALIEGDDG